MARSMAKAFICYRRADSEAWVGRLADDLKDKLGPSNVFRDIDSLRPGVEFRREIQRILNVTENIIVVIGPQWLTMKADDGARRIDVQDDNVRLEIEEALRSERKIIPALVGGAKMPSASELPESIRALAGRNAIEFTNRYWRNDVDLLLDTINDVKKRNLIYMISHSRVIILILLFATGIAGISLYAGWRYTESVKSDAGDDSRLEGAFYPRLQIFADFDADILIDNKPRSHVDHNSGFDYALAKVRVTDNAQMAIRANGFEKTVHLIEFCDLKLPECELRIGNDTRADIRSDDNELIKAMGSPSDIPHLVGELKSNPSHSARAWAAERLGYISDRSSVSDLLLAAQEDPDPYVQAQAASALGRIGDSSVLATLREAFQNYNKKESYGYMFEAAISSLEQVENLRRP